MVSSNSWFFMSVLNYFSYGRCSHLGPTGYTSFTQLPSYHVKCNTAYNYNKNTATYAKYQTPKSVYHTRALVCFGIDFFRIFQWSSHLWLFWCSICPISVQVQELDGVGPVDNRPSTDKLHHFVRKKERKIVTCDM